MGKACSGYPAVLRDRPEIKSARSQCCFHRLPRVDAAGVCWQTHQLNALWDRVAGPEV